MAQETRAQLYAKILANLPDNTTEAITPATDRAVEDAEVESCYNLLDDDATDVTYNPGDGANWDNPDPTEVGGALDDLAGRVTTIEGEPNQTAVQTPYTPTTPSDWDAIPAPTELQSSTDELAQRLRIFETNNFSQDVAYVSNYGSDVVGEFELGNPSKPFATIQAALNALPVSNCIVKALGGTYTVPPTTNLIVASKNNCIVDVSGCTLNGRIQISGNNITLNLRGSTLTDPTTNGTLIANGGADCSILLEGGKINGGAFLAFANAERISLQGGEIEATQPGQYALRVGEGSVVSNCIISSSQSSAIVGDATDINEPPFITNCLITSTAAATGAISDSGNITLDTCRIRGTWGIFIGTSPVTTNGLFPKFINCNIVADDRIMASNTLQGTGLFRGCRMEVLNPISGVANGYAFNLDGQCADLRIYDCQIITQDTCLKFGSGIDRVTDNTIFKDTIFFCNQDPSATGEILVEGTYTIETGSTRFINCTYNKALPALNPTYTFDYNSTTIAGLKPQSN